jgi:NAD(P)-dependent dehydrogenase (short-subunit alcohol dehydrogenase family)
LRIAWLTALGVKFNSEAAILNEQDRPAASKGKSSDNGNAFIRIHEHNSPHDVNLAFVSLRRIGQVRCEYREDMMILKDKIVAISGAASARGIGRATAGMMAAFGAHVVILDLDAGASQATADGLEGDSHIGIACDVTDREACQKAMDEIIERHGRIDVLCNNAGITAPLKLLEIGEEDWAKIIAVNLTGVLNLSQAAIPHMRKQKAGSIICMSSVSAQRGGGIFGGPHYSAAKAGVLGLAKAMAREFGPDGIRVNCITPGLIQTDITGGKLTDEMRVEILKGIPLNRLGEATDVAGAYVFLASDLSSYITGAVIDVNGGMLIHG